MWSRTRRSRSRVRAAARASASGSGGSGGLPDSKRRAIRAASAMLKPSTRRRSARGRSAGPCSISEARLRAIRLTSGSTKLTIGCTARGAADLRRKAAKEQRVLQHLDDLARPAAQDRLGAGRIEAEGARLRREAADRPAFEAERDLSDQRWGKEDAVPWIAPHDAPPPPRWNTATETWPQFLARSRAGSGGAVHRASASPFPAGARTWFIAPPASRRDRAHNCCDHAFRRKADGCGFKEMSL